MDGWANRQNPQKAKAVFDRLQEQYLATGNDKIKPNTGVYNKLIKAWMKSDDPSAPSHAESALRIMLEEYQSGNEVVRPNTKSFAQVMNCYARFVSKTEPNEHVEKVQELVALMENLHSSGLSDLMPDTRIFNAQIKALGQSRVKKSAQKAQRILMNMTETYRKTKDVRVRPDAASFINAINAWRNSRAKGSAQSATELLYEMERLYEEEGAEENDNLKPDYRVYNAAINVWARSRETGKAEKARVLLNRMKNLAQNGGSKYEGCAPNVRSYNNVMNACAFTKGDSKECMEAFRVAVDIFNEIRSLEDVDPSHITYGMFLKACGNLMPPSEKRETVIENIFRKCSKDGKVSEFVLDSLTEAAPAGLCRKLLGGDIENGDGIQIPEEWCCNL